MANQRPLQRIARDSRGVFPPRRRRGDGAALAGVGSGLGRRRRRDGGSAAPKRFVVQFMGNGVNPEHWWAKGEGAAMELSQSLEPLEPFKAKLNVINGLFNKAATGVGIHPGHDRQHPLRGCRSRRAPCCTAASAWIRCWRAASAQDTVQPSLVLACEQPLTGYHETNFSMAYSSHISWQTADSPVPMEVYPSLAFDSLFENSGSRRN